MKRYLGSLATALFFGASILGMGATARAQYPPPASQQPMEIPAETARPFQGNMPSQRTSLQAQSNQSTRPVWRRFTPPSGQVQPYGGGRNSRGYAVGQARPSLSQPAESPRQFQNYPRGRSSNSGYRRPPLNLQQPIVTPRRGSYSYPAPSYPAPRSVPSGGGYRGGYSGGGSRGGNFRGGSSSSGGRGSSGHGRR